MIKAALLDTKNGRRVRVEKNGEIGVIVHPRPPLEDSEPLIPVSEFFTNTAGSTDLRVNGSVTNVEFTINAIQNFDIYIKTISVILADSAARLDRYGALSALTNGTQLVWSTQDLGEVIIGFDLTTSLDWMRLAIGNPFFGTGSDAFKADLSGGGADAYLPVLDLPDIFGTTYGLRLRKDSKDKLIIRVRDDLSTGIDQHDAVGYGIKI